MTATLPHAQAHARARVEVQALAAETEQRRTLVMAAAGTLLALIVYTTPLAIMPAIAAGIGAGAGTQTWLLAAVSLGFATTLISAGALGDDYGRRRVLVGGAVVLAAASGVCALAPNSGVYLAGALAQGIGGSAVMACSLGLIGHAFPEGPARTRATGIWAAALGAGIGVGPLLAAALEPVAGWRGAFALTGVLALALGLVAQGVLVESRAPDHKPVDLAGMLLLGAAIGTLIGGLVRGRSGWSAPATLGLLGAAAVLMVAFTLVESRKRGPMLDLSLFREPPFVAVTVAAAATGLGVIALLSYLATMVQRGLGHSAFLAALLIAAWSVASVVSSLAVPHFLPGVSGRHQLAAGLVVIAAGMVTMYDMQTGSNPAGLVAGLTLAGIGSGIANSALGREAVASVPPGRGSLGSGANSTARYVGSSIGVSVVATIVAAHGTGPGAVMAGWNVAVLVTSGLSLLGAAAVLACRARA